MDIVATASRDICQLKGGSFWKHGRAGTRPGLASGVGPGPRLNSWMVLGRSSDLQVLRQNEIVFSRKCLCITFVAHILAFKGKDLFHQNGFQLSWPEFFFFCSPSL